MNTTTYLNASQVRARYGGISDMTIWRWTRDPQMGFPQPVRIKRIKFWDEAELDAFDVRAKAGAKEISGERTTRGAQLSLRPWARRQPAEASPCMTAHIRRSM